MFITIGEREVNADSRNSYQELSQLIEKQGSVTLEYKEYKQLEHMGTAIPSFTDSIKKFFGK